MDADVKRDLCNVIVMALADGEVAEEEKLFIDGLRRKLGVGAEQFGELCRQVQSDRKRLRLPKDPRRARAAIGLLVETARSDGRVAEAERKWLARIARHAGLDDEQLEALLAGPDAAPAEGPAPAPADDAALEAATEELYASFAAWDAEKRQQKLASLAAVPGATVALLRLLESYRAPDDMPDALELKTLVVRRLGDTGDPRVVYYLVQQATIGDQEDEVTCAALRNAAAEAIGKIVGEPFGPDAAGVRAARQWWGSAAAGPYDEIAF